MFKEPVGTRQIGLFGINPSRPVTTIPLLRRGRNSTLPDTRYVLERRPSSTERPSKSKKDPWSVPNNRYGQHPPPSFTDNQTLPSVRPPPSSLHLSLPSSHQEKNIKGKKILSRTVYCFKSFISLFNTYLSSKIVPLLINIKNSIEYIHGIKNHHVSITCIFSRGRKGDELCSDF